MKIYRGNIIMVDFGENQGSVQKGIRPAIVIQNDIGNRFSTTTIVVPITGSVKKKLPTHHKIYRERYRCLKYDSTILAEQVLTISKKQILDVLGFLKVEDRLKLNEILATSINLTNSAS